MKLLFLLLFILSANVFGADLTIVLLDIKKGGGKINYKLSEELYCMNEPDGQAYREGVVTSNPDKNGKQLITIENITPGEEYAFACFIDKDNNDEHNRNLINYPTEQFCLSNVTSLPLTGLPKYHKMAFKVGPAGLTILIKMLPH